MCGRADIGFVRTLLAEQLFSRLHELFFRLQITLFKILSLFVLGMLQLQKLEIVGIPHLIVRVTHFFI